MFEISLINRSFETNGWTIVKPLLEFDSTYLSEDLAQYEVNGFTVDFGFYGDGAYPFDGEFRVYCVKGEDWESPYAVFSSRDKELAMSVLKNFAVNWPIAADG